MTMAYTYKEIKQMYFFLSGGTIDITVHEKQGTKLKEIHKASGGPWGGTSVNRNFLDFIEKIVGSTTMKRFRDEFMEDYFDLLREFEMKKRSLDPDSDDLVTIRVPVALRDIYEEVTGENIKRALRNVDFEDDLTWVGDKLRMKAHIARDMFSDSIKNTISKVREILRTIAMHNVKTILMVGGYSECQLMQKAFQDAFAPDVSVIIPHEAGLAILKGAILFGHSPSIISSRILRYTYGQAISPKFDPKIHPKSKRNDFYDPPVCNDVFDCFASAGQSVAVGHMFSNMYTPVTDSQTSVVVNMYTSPDPTPRFVTDPGCRKIGYFEVYMPPFIGQRRRFEETVVFGDTKLYVKAFEPVSREVYETAVNFLG